MSLDAFANQTEVQPRPSMPPDDTSLERTIIEADSVVAASSHEVSERCIPLTPAEIQQLEDEIREVGQLVEDIRRKLKNPALSDRHKESMQRSLQAALDGVERLAGPKLGSS